MDLNKQIREIMKKPFKYLQNRIKIVQKTVTDFFMFTNYKTIVNR